MGIRGRLGFEGWGGILRAVVGGLEQQSPQMESKREAGVGA